MHDHRGRLDGSTGGGTFHKVDEGHRRGSLRCSCMGKVLRHAPDAVQAGFSSLDWLGRRSRTVLCTRRHHPRATIPFPSDGASPPKSIAGVEVGVEVEVEMLVGGCPRSSSYSS